MDLDPRDNLSRLPFEIKLIVINFVRPNLNKKSLSLVNRAWKEAVQTVLWETLRINFETVKTLDRLFHPGCDVLKNVRFLQIQTMSIDDNMLVELIAAIPKNRLRGFESILQHKHRAPIILPFRLSDDIRVLSMPTFPMPDHLLSSPFVVTGGMSTVTNLTMNVYPNPSVERIVTAFPRLKNLGLIDKPDRKELMRQFGPGAINGQYELVESSVAQSEKRGRRTLSLQRFELPNQWVGDLNHHFELKTLTRLTIHHCRYSVNLLRLLSSLFQQENEEVSLVSFSISTNYKNSGHFVRNITDFLISFSGLQKLHIECKNNVGEVDTTGIVHHGATLKSLFVVFEDEMVSDRGLRTRDVARIVAGCPEIQQFCLTLRNLENECHIRSKPNNWSTIVTAELQRALNSISKLQRLHTLCFTNMATPRAILTPTERKSPTFWRLIKTGELRSLVHKKAQTILAHLASNGSPLRVLAFLSFSGQKFTQETPDADGQQWPNYVYKREKLDPPDLTPFQDWKANSGEDSILHQMHAI